MEESNNVDLPLLEAVNAQPNDQSINQSISPSVEPSGDVTQSADLIKPEPPSVNQPSEQSNSEVSQVKPEDAVTSQSISQSVEPEGAVATQSRGQSVEPEAVVDTQPISQSVDSEDAIASESISQSAEPEAVIADQSVSQSVKPEDVIVNQLINQSAEPEAVVASQSVSSSIAPEAVTVNQSVSQSVKPEHVVGTQSVKPEHVTNQSMKPEAPAVQAPSSWYESRDPTSQRNDSDDDVREFVNLADSSDDNSDDSSDSDSDDDFDEHMPLMSRDSSGRLSVNLQNNQSNNQSVNPPDSQSSSQPRSQPLSQLLNAAEMSLVMSANEPATFIAPFLHWEPPSEPVIQPSDYRYQLVLACSGRSKCKICEEIIQKGYPRYGANQLKRYHMTTWWYHPACFIMRNLSKLKMNANEKRVISENQGMVNDLTVYTRALDTLNVLMDHEWHMITKKYEKREKERKEWLASADYSQLADMERRKEERRLARLAKKRKPKSKKNAKRRERKRAQLERRALERENKIKREDQNQMKNEPGSAKQEPNTNYASIKDEAQSANQQADRGNAPSVKAEKRAKTSTKSQTKAKAKPKTKAVKTEPPTKAKPVPKIKAEPKVKSEPSTTTRVKRESKTDTADDIAPTRAAKKRKAAESVNVDVNTANESAKRSRTQTIAPAAL